MKRREFLERSVVTLGGMAWLSYTLAKEAQAQQRSPIGANERIGVGVIGCGGMGNAHISALLNLKRSGYPVEIVAVCDVWQKRLEAAAARAGAKPYTDYRKLLENRDVDAVTIATPDHWHAPITIAAAETGRDVYCEKPMTHWRDFNEPKRVVEAIARYRRVMQVGTQGMSGSIWEQCARYVQSGVLGQLIQAQASDMRNGYLGYVYDPKFNDPDAKPGVNLDWKMWLGPAKSRPWDPGRFFAFRCFWDYSGGIGTDFFPHILTPLVRTMGLTFPKRVTASGGLYEHKNSGMEIPDIFTATIEYPEGPSVLLVASIANDSGLPMLIKGHKATLSFEGPGAVVRPQRAVEKEKPEITIQQERGPSLEEHFRDFLDCVRDRRKPRSHETLGYYVMVALQMAIHSYLEGRAYEFDPIKQEVKRL